MSTTGTTVWPNDVVAEPRELERASPYRLVCFLLSPFDPPEVFDSVRDSVGAACDLCARSAGIEIECRRADTLHEAKPIHDDIWRHIAAADFLIVDVTGLNPNVMIEFGVAAALRRPGQVILIKSADDTSRLPFNAFAQRYVSYRRSILGDQEFIAGLQAAMIQAITPAPTSRRLALRARVPTAGLISDRAIGPIWSSVRLLRTDGAWMIASSTVLFLSSATLGYC
jgi:hypothetical protein